MFTLFCQWHVKPGSADCAVPVHFQRSGGGLMGGAISPHAEPIMVLAPLPVPSKLKHT